jgi:predicted nucleic acid-binding protein
MSDKCFVDTNILVYAHDFATGAKHERARTLIEKLWSSGGGVLSTQVLQELCINLRRKSVRPLSVEETRRLIEDYASWDVVVNTAESVLQALTMESRYKLSFLGCTYSASCREFRRHGPLFRRLGGRADLRRGPRCQPVALKVESCKL